jgi:hypothetical protein
MATANSVLFEVTFKILASDSRLDAGKVVFFINPFNSIHACHVKRDNHTSLFFGKHEGLGNVGSSSVGDNNNVVLVGKSHNLLANFS